ncbi:4787_t:CDS:2, partial [Racocetra persica]
DLSEEEPKDQGGIRKKILLDWEEKALNHATKLVEVLSGFLEPYKDFEDSKSCEQIFNVEIAIFLNTFLEDIETTDENESNKLVAYQVIELISKADGYTYIYHTRDKLKESESFVFYCNCKIERKNKRAHIENIDKQRDTELRLLRFECEGSILITIKRSHELIYVRVHHLLHPKPQSITISSEIKTYIQNNKILTVPQLYHNIKATRLNGYLYLTQHQVYYWCKRLGLNEYKIVKDQAESTIQYLLQHSTFKVIIKEPTIIAFTTPLFDLLAKINITTIVIDATYKTNRLKYELYAILGIIDGAGFPLTYMFLKPGQNEKRTMILQNWFHIIKEMGIHNIETFLTDKDFSQITPLKKFGPKHAEYILDGKTLVNDNYDEKKSSSSNTSLDKETFNNLNADGETSSSSHIPDEEILSNSNTLDEEISSCSNLLNEALNNEISETSDNIESSFQEYKVSDNKETINQKKMEFYLLME